MSALTRFSLANRALIALITVFVFIGGVLAAGGLRRELIPALELPVVAVLTPVPGSSAEVIEEQVTRPLEAAVLAVPNVIEVQSTSGDNTSSVAVTLEYGTNIPDTQARIQRSVLAVQGLPENAEPMVLTGSIDDFPVMQLSASGSLQGDELAERLRTQVVPELEDISGVRSATVSGVGVQNITIDLNKDALDEAGLTAASVSGVLTSNGVVVPGGQITQDQTEFNVQVGTRITSLEELRALPLSDQGGLGALSPTMPLPGRGGMGMAAPAVPAEPAPAAPAPTPTSTEATDQQTAAPSSSAQGTEQTEQTDQQDAATEPTQPTQPTETAEPEPTPTSTSPATVGPDGAPEPSATPAPPVVPPGEGPSEWPSGWPTELPSDWPSDWPTALPTAWPSGVPTAVPTELPNDWPSDWPTALPSDWPSDWPTTWPTTPPTQWPTGIPLPPGLPSGAPTGLPSGFPTDFPTNFPTDGFPTGFPTDGFPGGVPTNFPSGFPTDGFPGGFPTDGLPGGMPPGAFPTDFPTGGFPTPTPSAPTITRLGDVATVSFTPAGEESIARTNGRPSVALSIVKVPGASTVDISHAVTERLPELAATIPDGELVTVFDQAPYIERSIEDLAKEGILGLIMAVLVVFAFLLSARLTLVTAVSIPASLLVALIGLQVTDNTLNILTLGALTIAIGRVVDDSIVVVENIKRKLDLGLPRKHAIITAVREVAGAITASTVVTVAVFLPIGLVGGQAGELFRPFAITTGIAMAASLLVALTIVPVLAYWFVKPSVRPADDAADTAAPAEQPAKTAPEAEVDSAQATGDTATVPAVSVAHERDLRPEDPPRGWMERLYVPSLVFALRRPFVTVLIAVAALAGAGLGATQLKTEFIGDAGMDSLQISQTLPAGSSIEAVDAASQKVEGVVAQVDGVETQMTTIGGGRFALFGGGSRTAQHSLTLRKHADSEVLAQQLRDEIGKLRDVGEVSVGAGGGGPGGASDITVQIQGPDDDTLRIASDQVVEAMRGVDGVAEVSSDLSEKVPTLQVEVDRGKALANGVTEAGVGAAVSAAVQGRNLGTVEIGNTEHDVLLRESATPDDVATIGEVVVGTNWEGDEVRVRQVASVKRENTAASVQRIDGNRAVLVTVSQADDDLGALTGRVQETLDGLTLPAGARADVGGVAADQAEAFQQLGLATLAAVAISYVVMVATFGSLAQPFMLLVSVPFAGIGAVLAMLITDSPFGVASFVGLLMLVGIVVTNAIVLIDRVNQYRAAGYAVRDAVTLGARIRMRPIIMTALATIFALLPMAFGLTGGGGFISRPLALVVVGGLLSSTVLTLLIVPVFYVILEGVLGRFRRYDENDRLVEE